MFNSGIENCIVMGSVNDVCDDIIKFSIDRLEENHPRDDYRELLELTVIFLGGILPNGIHFKKPGAIHHARWMAKAIYSLKIYLFREQFRLTVKEETALRNICIFIIRLYIKSWFDAPSAIKAPFQDLTFIKNLLNYIAIDKDTSQIAIKKFCGHLWYLSAELCGFAFFDEAVSIDTKRKMVKALNNEKSTSEMLSTTQRIIISPKNANELLEKEIEDFVCVKTNNLFKRFAINTDFLKLDPSTWRSNEDFQKSIVLLKKIPVINDVAERGKVFPKLRRKGRSQIQDISNDLSSNTEESRDYVFQIISKARHEEFLSKGEEILDSKIWSMPSAANNMLNRVRGHLESSSTNSSTSTSSSLDPVASPLLINIQNTSKDTGDSLQILCETMKKQIISRAFYGWLAYCRHLTTVRTHLSGLVNTVIIDSNDAETGLTKEKWCSFKNDSNLVNDDTKLEIFRLTYFGGVQHDIRKEVWPFLLGHYKFGSTVEERNAVDLHCKQEYETTMSEWMAVEAIIRQKDRETMAANLAKLSSESTSGGDAPPPTPNTSKVLSQELSNDVFEDNINFSSDEDNPPVVDDTQLEHNVEICDNPTNQINTKKNIENIPKEIDCDKKSLSSDEGLGKDEVTEKDMTIKKNTSEDTSLYCPTSVIVTTNISQEKAMDNPNDENDKIDSKVNNNTSKLAVDDNEGTGGSNHEQRSACISPASSQGGIYPVELVENFGLNVHRIDKDVQRCDRNYPYFTLENLDKLRNIICTYVWDHLEMGYMQGMCDLVAPLLVILDDETLSYSCFCLLMERMSANFPHSGGAMDTHFANMRSLVQILDSEMFELMHENGDFTHFYFCYRWFLLDFKRELLYDDVFTVWETIWAAKEMSSSHFVLFFALALVETYRDIILANHMDFTDIIKFFNVAYERTTYFVM
ncbi:hypothetical protein QTP88_022793 [Uroleucon formosanum]